jgi:hypothetical protein
LKIKLLPVLCAFIGFAGIAKAQTAAPLPSAQPYGTIDKADLELTACDFEKDANAEILFDKGTVYLDHVERHIRIKIFTEAGKSMANVLEVFTGSMNGITDVEAETFNLVDGKIEITKLDHKQLYIQRIDNWRFKMSFALPNVRAGSVIEYHYTQHTGEFNYPKWYFQNIIPERYNELNVDITDMDIRPEVHTYQPFAKQEDIYTIVTNHKFRQTVMTNVPSLTTEPYMTSLYDNLQSIWYNITGYRYIHIDMTWKKVAKLLAESEEFGLYLNSKLPNEDSILVKAKKLKSTDEKVAFTFNKVRDMMKWDGNNSFHTDIGTGTAWKNKVGNSAEINLILCHLLKREGLNALPVIVSTRDNGKVNPAHVDFNQFNSTIVAIPNEGDTTQYYVLDASDKYNTYNQIPAQFLNSVGFAIDVANENGKMIGLEDDDPIRKIVMVNAEVTADGKMTGTTDISDFGYNHNKVLHLYNTLDNAKFKAYLTNNDNSINISDIKLDNMDVDSLPLATNFNFKADVQGADQGYLYLTTNMFSSLYTNPFISDKRKTDIDFGYRDNYAINYTCKIPAGYSVYALPKNINTIVPDGSIVFKRLIIVEDGVINVRYSIDHKKTFYFKDDYADFHEFYKKMYEALNEQIVLKKNS